MMQMGKLTGVTNTAISAYASTSPEFSINRNLYPTMSRVSITSRHIASGIQLLLKVNNWTRFGIVNDNYQLSTQVCDTLHDDG
jgi:hypothetical protein